LTIQALEPTALMDTCCCGSGERLVFELYTKGSPCSNLRLGMARHGIFAEGAMGHGRYEDSVISLETAG